MTRPRIRYTLLYHDTVTKLFWVNNFSYRVIKNFPKKLLNNGPGNFATKSSVRPKPWTFYFVGYIDYCQVHVFSCFYKYLSSPNETKLSFSPKETLSMDQLCPSVQYQLQNKCWENINCSAASSRSNSQFLNSTILILFSDWFFF